MSEFASFCNIHFMVKSLQSHKKTRDYNILVINHIETWYVALAVTSGTTYQVSTLKQLHPRDQHDSCYKQKCLFSAEKNGLETVHVVDTTLSFRQMVDIRYQGLTIGYATLNLAADCRSCCSTTLTHFMRRQCTRSSRARVTTTRC